MKKINIPFIMIFISNYAVSQININPDPYGDPWIVGGIPEMTSEIQSEIDSIPNFILDTLCNSILLPDSVDSSHRPYMREIFLQHFNSCAQAASIGYMFTYEINYFRNIASDHDLSVIRYHKIRSYVAIGRC